MQLMETYKSLNVVFHSVNRAHRPLINPQFRLPIRNDFPDIFQLSDPYDLCDMLDRELQKNGDKLGSDTCINIAFSQKHFDSYLKRSELQTLRTLQSMDAASQTARALKTLIERDAPGTQVYVADCIYEVSHLDRKNNQNAIHAMTSPQSFEIRETPDIGSFDFLYPKNRPSYFLLADYVIEQGTTMANLASFITANGGIVLGAATFAVKNDVYFSQKEAPLAAIWSREERQAMKSFLNQSFSDNAKNGLRIPEIAAALERGIVKDRKLDKKSVLFKEFSTVLRASWVHSLDALTDGECCRLIETFTENDRQGFENFLNQFQKEVNKYEYEDASLNL